jgi:hypothetical protein
VLTPVMTATTSITTYSAMFATTPVPRVLRKNSVIFSPPATLNSFSTVTSLRQPPDFNNGSFVGIVEPQ